MSVETAADVAGFFDDGDHGSAAKYTLAAGGQAVALDVILSAPHQLVDVGELGMQQVAPSALANVADLPTGYGKGDTVVIGSDTWTVERPELDGTRKVATLILRTP